MSWQAKVVTNIDNIVWSNYLSLLSRLPLHFSNSLLFPLEYRFVAAPIPINYWFAAEVTVALCLQEKKRFSSHGINWLIFHANSVKWLIVVLFISMPPCHVIANQEFSKASAEFLRQCISLRCVIDSLLSISYLHDHEWLTNRSPYLPKRAKPWTFLLLVVKWSHRTNDKVCCLN